jgi:hypothetical protein
MQPGSTTGTSPGTTPAPSTGTTPAPSGTTSGAAPGTTGNSQGTQPSSTGTGTGTSTNTQQGAGTTGEAQHVWPALARAARERGCLFTTAASDAEGNVHSAIAMVWDDRCAYGLVNGADPRFRNSYGGTLTMWREIEYAATVVPEFDFEGSCVETVEQFYRRFGGQLCPYMLIARSTSPRLNLARRLQRLLRRQEAKARKTTGATEEA